jgi:lipoprotein
MKGENMIKKKVFAVIMYVLACCTVLSACTFATKEETEQSSEKKAKKKSKKSKDKAEKNKVSTEEDTKSEEKAKNLAGTNKSGDSKELKDKLVEELDDFLASDCTMIVISNEATNYKIVEVRVETESDVIYSSLSQLGSENDRTNIITDGKIGYIKYGDSEGWYRIREEDAGLLDGGPLIDGNYIHYISLFYAALDAGLDPTYSSSYGAYYMEIDKETAEKLNLQAIRSKLSNSDKLAEFDMYLSEYEAYLKTYDEQNGIKLKTYLLFMKDDEIAVTETLNSESNETLEISIATRAKAEENAKTKEEQIEIFNTIKSSDTSN